MKQWDKLFVPLRAKFMVLFMALITIPYVISGIVTYQGYMSQVKVSATVNTTQMTEQIRINLDRFIKEMERLSLGLYYDNEVINILSKHTGDESLKSHVSFNDQQKMMLFISSLEFDRPEIRNVVLMSPDGNLFSSKSKVSNTWSEASEPWISDVKLSEGEFVIVKPHHTHYYSKDDNPTISVARKIYDPYSYDYLGMIKIDLTAGAFQSLIAYASGKPNAHDKLYLLDRDKQLLYPYLTSEEPLLYMKNDDYLTASVVSDYTGIQVVGIASVIDMQQDAYRLVRSNLFTSGAALLLAYLLALLTSNYLVKPIHHLRSKMKLVQNGSFTVRSTVVTNDEIGVLSGGFNNMVAEIERLVREVYETKLRERDAELSALQSQINPHFLYNMLESMNAVAMKHRVMELSDLISDLGALLRYTIHNQIGSATLRDELQFVEAYVEIESSRLDNRLLLTNQVDSSFESCLVPKLILQPFVENVIEHGFASTSARVEVTIQAWMEEDDVWIRISDTGIGMTDEFKSRLEERMQRRDHLFTELVAFDDKRAKGVALRNVFQRIRIRYGEPYGVQMDYSAESGAAFLIRLPFQWRDK
jgi:two-component system sensor histidine kinase YesM